MNQAHAQHQQIHSPFRWPGGKFYARKHILNLVPEHSTYCEPLCGGASIFFAKQKVTHNILNDKDPELVNCLRHIRDYVEELIAALEGLQPTREAHSYYKKVVPNTPLEAAARWFFLNRISYSGIMRRENCYFGYSPKNSMQPQNWPRVLRQASYKLQGVELSNDDFATVIAGLEQGAYAFVDPPYVHAGKLYACAFTFSDHERLCQSLYHKRRQMRFLLTYDDCPEVRELYDWCYFQQAEWNYTIGRTDDQKGGRRLASGYRGRRKPAKELFITNYIPEYGSYRAAG
jgi:DNA adenine methylase